MAVSLQLSQAFESLMMKLTGRSLGHFWFFSYVLEQLIIEIMN